MTSTEVLVDGNIVVYGDSQKWNKEKMFGIQFPDNENGYEQEPHNLDWINSAKIWVNPEKDAVQLTVSVGDPRGCFVLTLRRNDKGEVLLHLPHPEGSMLHMPLTELHSGTYRVG